MTNEEFPSLSTQFLNIAHRDVEETDRLPIVVALFVSFTDDISIVHTHTAVNHDSSQIDVSGAFECMICKKR